MVPTTPTWTDKQEEVRKLNVEIAKLGSVKDTAARAAKEAMENAEEAQGRANGLKRTITELESATMGVSTEVQSFLSNCRKSLEEAGDMMREIGELAQKLSERVATLSAEIEQLEKQKNQILLDIGREAELMSQKRKDLGVYHRRILVAADKYMPGEKIDI